MCAFCVALGIFWELGVEELIELVAWLCVVLLYLPCFKD